MSAFGVCPVCRQKRFILDGEGMCIDCAAERAWVQKYGPGSVAEFLAPVLRQEDGAESVVVDEEVRTVPENVLEEVATAVNKQPPGRRTGPGVCRKCGRQANLKARGLCASCWDKERRKELSSVAGFKITVDFSSYPELLEALKERARRDFRPVELEILYLLHQTLKEPTS